MPKSSKNKHHKRSKHSSKDYSDSDDDVVKTKEKSVRDENSSRVRHDSVSGEKRKKSPPSREGKGCAWDLSGHGNGEVLEEHVSSKRRKEKLDVVDRWSGGESERPNGDGNFEKEVRAELSVKDRSRLKENSDKGESLRIESKSRKYESGILSERKEESSKSVLLEIEEGSGKVDSRRKHEKDSFARKEGKESKEKHRRPDREKNEGGESKNGEIEESLVDLDYGKQHESQSGDFGEEKQSKRARKNTERTMMDDLRTPDSDDELDRRSRKRREDSNERDKYHDDIKYVEDRRLSSKSDRVKDVKRRDDKQKDGGYADKYRGDHYKDDKRKEEKNKEEADKDYYYYYDDDKYQGDGEKDYKRRDDRHREEVKRSSRQKDGKRREDEVGGSRRKDDKYREGLERDSKWDKKYQDEGHRERRRKDARYDEDDDKEVSRRADEKYHSHQERDDRDKNYSYGGEGYNREYRKREEKHHEDIERDIHQYDSKKMDDFDKEKRHRDDAYASGLHSRKSTTYDHSPTHDDQSARYRSNENENDSKSRVSKDQRSDAEKRSTNIARRNISVEELTPKGGGSREEKQYYAEDVRGSRESGIEIPRGNEVPQADADSLSISSPFVRNTSNLRGGSKPPPSFRTGLDSPLPLGSAEYDARGRPHGHQRRTGGDPQMGRISGHGWRWPSPMANGFLPFPHAPPVAFPSVVMQPPIPSPSIFGVHPSMELNPAGFPSPGNPMGWRNQVNNQFPSLHAWDASNAVVYGQDSHMYGRNDPDRSRIRPPGLSREDIGDLSQGLNRTESMERERSYSEKDKSNFSADDVQVDSGAIGGTPSKNFVKNDAEVPVLEEARGSEETLKKDYLCIGQVYLSRLEISVDLTEPELFDECTGLMDLDRGVLSDSDDVRLLHVEGAIDSKMDFHSRLSHELFEPVDDSVYKKSIDLYIRHKESGYAEQGGNKSTFSNGLVVSSHNGGEHWKLLNSPANEEQGASDDALQNPAADEVRLQNGQQQPEEAKIDMILASDSNNIINEEMKFFESKCGPPPLVFSDMSSESRIHNLSP